jgi:fructose-1,6-bisphosphatase II
MLAVSDRGTMLDASSVYYMEKLVANSDAHGVLDLSQSLTDNIRALAKAKNKRVNEIKVAILDRPRHADAIEEIRTAGAHTRLILDGDVAAGINAAREDNRIDMCYGVGGSPEGVAVTCAIKALGGFIQGRLMPGTDEERDKGAAAGLKFDYVYSADELVASDNTFFVATGVTDGELLRGVRFPRSGAKTQSLVMRSRSGTVISSCQVPWARSAAHAFMVRAGANRARTSPPSSAGTWRTIVAERSGYSAVPCGKSEKAGSAAPSATTPLLS